MCRGRPTDVYALGACLYTFAFGRIPFNAPNVFKLFQVVQHEPLRFPETPAVSSDLKDLLLRMLCKVSAAAAAGIAETGICAIHVASCWCSGPAPAYIQWIHPHHVLLNPPLSVGLSAVV